MSEAVQLKLIELEIEKTTLEQCKLQPSTPQERVGFRPREAHLPVMAESGDPLAFFACFEKKLQLNGVRESEYAKLLPSHLNERAKRVFAAMSHEHCLDYTFVRSQIIAIFRASADSCLDKFRSIRRSGTENQKMFVGRLTEIFSYYLEAGELKTLTDLKEAVILEQFFATLDGATKQFVTNNCPKNSLEAAQLADLSFENRTRSQKFPVNIRNKAPNAETENRATSNVVKDTNKAAMPQAARKKFARSKNACFICNSVDHRQAQCPLKSVESEANRANFRRKNDRTAGLIKTADNRKKKLSKFEFPVQIQNNELIGYRDTGSPRTFVQSRLFPDVDMSGEMKIWGINDVDPVTVPTCVLEIRPDYFYPRKVVSVEAGLLPNMVWDCLLGNDIFDGTAINDVIGNTDGFVAADASCAEAEMSDLCTTETHDSNLHARRGDDGSTSAQRQVAPSEVISREPRCQVTYLSRSISSDSSLQCDSATHLARAA